MSETALPNIDQMPQTGIVFASSLAPRTRYHYSLRIRRFLDSGLPLNGDGLATYLAGLREAGKGVPEQRLSVAAVRRSANEEQIRERISNDAGGDGSGPACQTHAPQTAPVAHSRPSQAASSPSRSSHLFRA